MGLSQHPAMGGTNNPGTSVGIARGAYHWAISQAMGHSPKAAEFS
jgi:hypothetical protein